MKSKKKNGVKDESEVNLKKDIRVLFIFIGLLSSYSLPFT